MCVHLPQTTEHINPKRWGASELMLQLNNLAELQKERERVGGGGGVASLSTVQITFNNSEWTEAERHCRPAETRRSVERRRVLLKVHLAKLEDKCVFFCFKK